jgi:hypothetical protein
MAAVRNLLVDCARMLEGLKESNTVFKHDTKKVRSSLLTCPPLLPSMPTGSRNAAR